MEALKEAFKWLWQKLTNLVAAIAKKIAKAYRWLALNAEAVIGAYGVFMIVTLLIYVIVPEPTPHYTDQQRIAFLRWASDKPLWDVGFAAYDADGTPTMYSISKYHMYPDGRLAIEFYNIPPLWADKRVMTAVIDNTISYSPYGEWFREMNHIIPEKGDPFFRKAASALFWSAWWWIGLYQWLVGSPKVQWYASKHPTIGWLLRLHPQEFVTDYPLLGALLVALFVTLFQGFIVSWNPNLKGGAV